MRLSHHDYDLVLKLLAELYAESDFKSFPELTLSVLRRAVPGDRFSYNEMSAEKKSARVLACPTVAEEEKLGGIFSRHFASHPVISDTLRNGTLTARTISDFWSQQQFRGTALYDEYYQPLGINHQLSIYLCNSPRLQIGLACNRSSNVFSARDKAVLDQLLPHLRQVYVDASRRVEIKAEAELLSNGLEVFGHGMICLTETMSVHWMNWRASTLLEKYFESGPAAASGLPQELRGWMQQSKMPGKTVSPLVVKKADGQIIVRITSDERGRNWLLLKEKCGEGLPQAACGAAGLTRRETEVLTWMVEGKSNQEIAVILGISPRTVEKHVEIILKKLGSENRIAAIVQAQSWCEQ